MGKNGNDKSKSEVRRLNRKITALTEGIGMMRQTMSHFPPPPALLHTYVNLMNAVAGGAPEDAVKVLQKRVQTMFEGWIQKWIAPAEAPKKAQEEACPPTPESPNGSSSSPEPASSSGDASEPTTPPAGPDSTTSERSSASGDERA